MRQFGFSIDRSGFPGGSVCRRVSAITRHAAVLVAVGNASLSRNLASWVRHRKPLRWRDGICGTAALEFALATPLLLLMVGGAADFGLAECYRTMLANAVAAGAQYAYLTGTGVSTANIQTAVQDAMYLPSGAAANLTFSFTGSSPGVQGAGWYCVTGSGPTVTASTQGATCSDGSTAGYYLWFKATYTTTPLLSGIITTANRTMSEQVTVRLQ